MQALHPHVLVREVRSRYGCESIMYSFVLLDLVLQSYGAIVCWGDTQLYIKLQGLLYLKWERYTTWTIGIEWLFLLTTQNIIALQP